MRHCFGQFNVRCEQDAVRLTFYLTTPVFDSSGGNDAPTRIRITRKAMPRFRWGQDYAEYFDGVNARGSRCLFDGPIEPINRRKFEYLDTTVETGQTYVYWVSSEGFRPTGPAAIRMRDRRVWWPHDLVSARLDAIAKAHPDLASVTSYGTSVGGRPLPGLRVGCRDRCLALIGAIHAGESGPELMIPAVERLIAQNKTLLKQVGIAILPSVNVDERERLVNGCPWYLRTNARGVDINRNFDADWDVVDFNYGYISSDPNAGTYRGPRPVSEPETQAVVAFMEAVKPRAVLSYHALASITGACCLAPRKAADDPAYVNDCKAIFDPFVAAFYPDNQWNAGLRFGTSTGSLPAYVYDRWRVPCFDMEHDGNPDALPSLTDNTNLKILEACQDRHYHGILAIADSILNRMGND